MNWTKAYIGALSAMRPVLHNKEQRQIVETLTHISCSKTMAHFLLLGGLKVGNGTMLFFDEKYEVAWQRQEAK